MSVASHLDQLRRKHEGLEIQIQETQRHPSTDNLQITKLKREKLRLKEEIEKLSATLH